MMMIMMMIMIMMYGGEAASSMTSPSLSRSSREPSQVNAQLTVLPSNKKLEQHLLAHHSNSKQKHDSSGHNFNSMCMEAGQPMSNGVIRCLHSSKQAPMAAATTPACKPCPTTHTPDQNEIQSVFMEGASVQLLQSLVLRLTCCCQGAGVELDCRETLQFLQQLVLLLGYATCVHDVALHSVQSAAFCASVTRSMCCTAPQGFTGTAQQ